MFLFEGREFVWSGEQLDAAFVAGLPPELSQPDPITGPPECAPHTLEEVTCRLHLDREGGSLYAKKWVWSFRKRGEEYVQRRWTSPGTSGWEWGRRLGENQPSENERRGDAQVQKMRDHGLTVYDEGDARDHAWLQSVFGSDLAHPTIQNADGTPHPVRVYRVHELLPNTGPPPGSDKIRWPGVIEAGHPPDAVSTGAPQPKRPEVGYTHTSFEYDEMRWHPPFIMYRNGDVILIVEFYQHLP